MFDSVNKFFSTINDNRHQFTARQGYLLSLWCAVAFHISTLLWGFGFEAAVISITTLLMALKVVFNGMGGAVWGFLKRNLHGRTGLAAKAFEKDVSHESA